MTEGTHSTYTVPAEDAAQRLDAYLVRCLPTLSRSYLQQLIADGHILHNEKTAKAGTRLKKGDVLRVFVPDPTELSVEAEDIPIDIIYEDCDILILNKARGITVHPAPGHMTGTLVNALLWHCKEHLSGINGVLRPGIVHRIDKDTSGLLLVCKNDLAHRDLAAQLEAHSIERCYLGIVHGRPKNDSGSIDAPIGRDKRDRKKMAVVEEGGKHAVTHYEVLSRFAKHSLLRFQLETGRTHQIRVHMAQLGHPLLYDPVYGTRAERGNDKGQMLHAGTLGFVHPTTGEHLRFEADPPEDFNRALEKCKKERN